MLAGEPDFCNLVVRGHDAHRRAWRRSNEGTLHDTQQDGARRRARGVPAALL
jgi:hypothetical protein